MNEKKMISGSLGKDARYTEPTHGLRWMKGRLQQLWRVTQCGEVNQVVKQWSEWRDVPDASFPRVPTLEP